MRASNWRSDIFFVIELGLDSPFHITVKPRNISDFFGFVKIPSQNLLLPSVPILYRLYTFGIFIANMGGQLLVCKSHLIIVTRQAYARPPINTATKQFEFAPFIKFLHDLKWCHTLEENGHLKKLS